MLKITEIRLDGGTQSRANIDDLTVAEYVEAMADPNTIFPPIVVYYDGKEYWLADGFHRIAAWKQIGRQEVPADVREGHRRDAVLHSVASNSAHGLRRTKEDKRHAVTLLLEDLEWGTWSDREIARRCSVSNTFVSNLRSELSVNELTDSSDRPRTVNRGDTTYTMNTANIGKQQAEQSPWDDNPDQQENTEPDNPTDQGDDKPEHQPHQEPEIDEENDDLPEDQMSDEERAARAALNAFTRLGLEDEIIGLRINNQELQTENESLKRQVEEQEDQLSYLASDDQAQKLIKAVENGKTWERQSKTHQAEAADLQRLNNAQKAIIKRLKKQLADLGVADA